MKKLLCLLAAAALLPSICRSAQIPGFGVMIGEPSGATMKYWVDKDEAWQFGLGLSFVDDLSLQAQADYLLHIYEIAQYVGLTQTPVYCGLGVRLNGPEDDAIEAGIRFPIGLSIFFDSDDVELFAEISPVLNVAPSVRGDLNGAVGIRFYR